MKKNKKHQGECRDACLDNEEEQQLKQENSVVEETEIDVTREQESITENGPVPAVPNRKYPFSCKINDHMVAYS